MKIEHWRSGVSSENAKAGLKPDTRNLKPMLGERFTTLDNVQKKELFSKKINRSVLTDKAPFDNNDVRLALKYAIDREEIVNKVLNGYSTVGNDPPIGPAYRFHATEAELSRRVYDPDKAGYHLKKAGLEGHTFTLHVADAPYAGAVDTALLYQQQDQIRRTFLQLGTGRNESSRALVV